VKESELHLHAKRWPINHRRGREEGTQGVTSLAEVNFINENTV
jgi:hypothetical protein